MFVERVRRDRELNERYELDNLRIAWDRMSERDRALILSQYYEDVVVPAEEPRRRRRWWQR